MINTYDAMDVTVIWDGVIITGFADGDAITIGQNEESFSKQVGIQGDVTLSETNDKTGVSTLALKGTSPAVQKLKSDARLKGDSALKSLQVINDNTGGGIMGGTKCRIKKQPENSFSNEEGTLEFEIEITDYTDK